MRVCPLPRLRSLLFVPGNRPDRFDKARASGADVVCIDLEDGVAPGGAKDDAREYAVTDLSRNTAVDQQCATFLRINSPRTAEGARDLRRLREFTGKLPPLVIPKVDSAGELCELAQSLSDRPGPPAQFVPMIETLKGLEAAASIASALPNERIVALFFGAVDLSLELGCALEWEPLLYSRSRVIHAARMAGILAIDSPNLAIDNPADLETEARHSAALGFSGKAAIHPAQLGPINRAFTPTEAQVSRARAVIEAYESMAGGVALLDGKLIERPVYLAAQRLVARAERHITP